MTMRYAGLSLAVGVVLVFIASFLHPGNTLVHPVDQTDFAQAVAAIGDAANLSHIMTLLAILSVPLMSIGLLSLYPLATRRAGLGSALLQFGIFISILEWSCMAVGMGMRLFVAHLTQRAAHAPDGSELQAIFQSAALAIHTNSVAVFLAFVALFPLASLLLGLGVASRIPTMNVFKIASYGLVLFGAAGQVNFLIALFVGGGAPTTYFGINAAVSSLAAICLFAVGVGMYQGRRGLAEEGAAG